MTNNRLNLDEFYKEQLNAEQYEAVVSCDGPSLVIAGAGSGKTRVLTYKIAYLLHTGYQPFHILALTFTNKAAREMKERISSLVGDEPTRYLWMGTFHSIFAKILRIEAEHIAFQSDFTIYDASDSKSLIKNIIKDFGLDDKIYKPSVIASKISEAKNLLMLPEQYELDGRILQRDKSEGLAHTAKIYHEYRNRLLRSNAMDFDDLLLNIYLLFQKNETIRNKYKERFKYILVDEYQDTNFAQHKIIHLLTDAKSKILVVGDDAQSIYAFRGANIDNILQFTSQYPGAKLFKLEQNYRSTQNIVNAANSIISHNQRQIEKKVYSKNDVGSLVKIISAYSDKEEALKVAGEIARFQKRDNIPFSDIAILYRTNAQSRVLEETLRSYSLPYQIYGGLSFYQRKEVKDVLAYFRLISNPNDDEAFRRIINYPARGIGQTTLSRVASASSQEGITLMQAATEPEQYVPQLNNAAKNKLKQFCQLILTLRERSFKESAYSLAVAIVRETGIGADLCSSNDAEYLARKENVQELLNSIQIFEDEQREEYAESDLSLNNYLTQVALMTDKENDTTTGDKITLMTIHAAKGLEYDVVFITGLENNLFPNSSAQLYPQEMEEERRLFYVALTRAKSHCIITYAKSRMIYGSFETSQPSPFLYELNKNYVAWNDVQPNSTQTSQRRFEIPSRKPLAALTPLSTTCNTTAIPPTPSSYKTGDHVAHERFGKGIIEKLEGAGDDAKATVRFENAGTKNLLLKFAKLKRV